MRQKQYRMPYDHDHHNADSDDPATLLARALEADLHAEGWDRPAAMGVLHAHADTLRLSLLRTAGLFPNPNLPPYAQPHAVELPHLLGLWNDALAGGKIPAPLEPLRRYGHGFIGYLLVTEAWGLPRTVSAARFAEYQAYLRSGRRIAHHPDRVEQRIATVAVATGPDTPARHIALIRERGGLPALDNGKRPGSEWSGRLFDALDRLTATTHHAIETGAFDVPRA